MAGPGGVRRIDGVAVRSLLPPVEPQADAPVLGPPAPTATSESDAARGVRIVDGKKRAGGPRRPKPVAVTKPDVDKPTNPLDAALTKTKGKLSKAEFEHVAKAAAKKLGLPQKWATSRALHWIIQHESNYRVHANNKHSTAYGLFQALWAKEGSTALQQTIQGLRYIDKRYGSPEKAVAFWKAHGWY